MIALLARTGAFVRHLRGPARTAFAFGAGALSALGFAPFELFPLLLLGFAALVLLLDAAARGPHRLRVAAACGFFFGFGQFLVGLHWVGFAFMVDAADHAWQLPFVAVLFPGGLALFYAGAAAGAMAFWRRGAARLFVFTVAVMLAEYLRGHVLTGFPWNIPAYGWGASLSVLQTASLFGAYGLSLFTVLFGASLAELFAARPAWRVPAAMTGLFALFFVFGALRLAALPTAEVPGVRLRLVQPAIPQMEKYRFAYVVRNWERLTRLSTMPAKSPPDIVVWPEAAPPFLLARQPEALDWIDALNANGTILMTGALRATRDAQDEAHYFNSFYVFMHGVPVAVYDKAHLVPFGEYLPFEKTLAALGLEKITGIAGGFGRGDGPHTYDVPGAPAAGPLICYEILFPGAVTGARRPGWFVNVTDDSWFGPWAGPRQHLLVARVRAIEEGIPVARAANSGISAIIDPLGRITSQLELNRIGVVDGALPASVAQTIYSRTNPIIFWLLMAGFLSLIWVTTQRN
jgi:apolipoprotein N-acyltransferase